MKDTATDGDTAEDDRAVKLYCRTGSAFQMESAVAAEFISTVLDVHIESREE
jgi:hypothetical protein